MAEQKKIHPNFLKYPDLVEQRDRALKALMEYDKVGSVRCTNRSYGPWQLCVDVKDRKTRKCAPEIRESKEQEFYDSQVRDFWELDFDGDLVAPDTCKYEFPEFFSEGRSGGYFVFDGIESKRAGPALSEFKRHGTWSGGSREPLPDGDLESALCAFDDTIDPYRWIEDVQDFGDDEEKRKAWIQEDVDKLTSVYGYMADVFESATEWAKVVLSQMEWRGDNYEGRNYYELDSLLENEMFDFFDFSEVHVEIKDDECTVSWPQHTRQFKDRGDWVECSKDDEEAKEWRDGTHRKFVLSGPCCLSTKMSKDQLVELLNEELYASVKAIRKLAVKGLLTKEK